LRHQVGLLNELEPGRVRQAGLPDGRPICLARTVDGQVFAVDDTCSHEDGTLSEGELIGDEIQCPMHYSRFDVRTGEPRSLPAFDPVQTFQVILGENGELFVELPEQAPSS
jgi:3-phenylpropionate/trans-cinnamate dioxygenase ferredoxin subunit